MVIKKFKAMSKKIRGYHYALLGLMLCPGGAFAADLLSGVYTTDIAPTLGSSGTVWTIIYTIEILGAAYSFLIKKSLPAFLGVIALMMFTTVAFAVITPAS